MGGGGLALCRVRNEASVTKIKVTSGSYTHKIIIWIWTLKSRGQNNNKLQTLQRKWWPPVRTNYSARLSLRDAIDR